MEALAVVAFPLLTMPFAEGVAKAAFPAPAGACLGVGVVAAGLLGCWSGTSPPTCTERQAWLPASPRVQHIANRAIDSKSNSATLLKAVQMQHKCDKNTCVVTDKHTQFEKFAGEAQVPSHTRLTCDTFQIVFASPAGSRCLRPKLCFVTKQDVSCCQTHIVQRKHRYNTSCPNNASYS